MMWKRIKCHVACSIRYTNLLTYMWTSLFLCKKWKFSETFLYFSETSSNVIMNRRKNTKKVWASSVWIIKKYVNFLNLFFVVDVCIIMYMLSLLYFRPFFIFPDTFKSYMMYEVCVRNNTNDDDNYINKSIIVSTPNLISIPFQVFLKGCVSSFIFFFSFESHHY